MRAPVYRHVEAQNTIAGISLNGFILVLGVAFAVIQLLGVLSSLAAIAGTYGALRLAASGRPPLHWQHLAVWHVRRRLLGGRLAAAARARTPQFPFGPYASRDLAHPH